MEHPKIEEGELLAYLDGERLPHVEAALRDSAALRDELERLRQTEAWLRAALSGKTPRPSAQDLVDVVAGQATPAQRLLVAAWVRQDPAAQKELAALQAEAQTRPARLPHFIARPLVAAAGVRAARAEDVTEQAFYVAELQAQITVRVAPLPAERWRVEGYVTQQHEPVAGIKVHLASPTARPRPRYTDEAGFFTFRSLAQGVYELHAYFAQGRVTIPNITLKDE